MVAVLTFLLLTSTALFADPLVLGPEDVHIEQSREGGFDLYVRTKPGIGSILITESTVDPTGRETNYALRNPVWHPRNGDERRKLDGEFLNAQEQGHYFLVSSTVFEVSEFGPAFAVFIPYIVEFGYPWARSGELYIGDLSWINIRTFALPYADYEGAFRDNPFVIRVFQPTPPEPAPEEPVVDEEEETDHLPSAIEAFEQIAEASGTKPEKLADGAEIVDTVRALLDETDAGGIDLVIAIDTTGSMRESIEHVRKELVPMLLKDMASRKPLRVGVVLFRDYYDDYLVRHLPFQEDLSVVQRFVNNARAFGGGDIPEAVYEALYATLTRFEWIAKGRLIVLIGDAPPHPRPRGTVTKDMVFSAAAEKEVKIHAILLPHP